VQFTYRDKDLLEIASTNKSRPSCRNNVDSGVLTGRTADMLDFKGFTVVTMKNAVFWDVTSYGFITIDVSEERVASIFRVEEIKRAKKSVRRFGSNLLVTV
jgi:hypothetical protein